MDADAAASVANSGPAVFADIVARAVSLSCLARPRSRPSGKVIGAAEIGKMVEASLGWLADHGSIFNAHVRGSPGAGSSASSIRITVNSGSSANLVALLNA